MTDGGQAGNGPEKELQCSAGSDPCPEARRQGGRRVRDSIAEGIERKGWRAHKENGHSQQPGGQRGQRHRHYRLAQRLAQSASIVLGEQKAGDQTKTRRLKDVEQLSCLERPPHQATYPGDQRGGQDPQTEGSDANEQQGDDRHLQRARIQRRAWYWAQLQAREAQL